MKIWITLENILRESILPEEKMYRGDSSVRMKDLRTLFQRLRDDGKGNASTSDEKVLSGDPNPEGDFIYCHYEVSGDVWDRWSRTPEFAKIFGATDNRSQYAGMSVGGTMVKKNYGGRISYEPGKPSNAHEMQPSAVDKYDVMMVADVVGAHHSQKDKNVVLLKGNKNAYIIVKKIVWSPSIGSFDERRERLQALMTGMIPKPLTRRPQPEIPQKDKETEVPPPKDLPKFGKNATSPSSGYASLGSKSSGKPYKRSSWLNATSSNTSNDKKSSDDEEFTDKDR